MWTDREWQSRWEATLVRNIADEAETTGIPPGGWKVSGRATKRHPNKEDRAFWETEGWKIAQTYADWRVANPYLQLWHTPDGRPGNELDFVADFGGERVRVIIDRVFQYVHAPETLAVVDLKSGNSMPDEVLQLELYASAIEIKFGTRPQFGGFFNARRGSLVALEPLAMTTEQIVGLVQDFVRQRELGAYLPNPGRQCTWCEVNTHCKWVKLLSSPVRGRAA
jgi:hypothetical protein